MKQSSFPAKFALPFAASAGASYIRTIPQASQVGVTAGAASLTDGFPPVTFDPVSAGGTPPSGADMNGILNWVTSVLQSYQSGYLGVWDGSFATAIGGYPMNAIVSGAVAGSYYVSTTDDNMTTPGASGAAWQSLFNGLALASDLVGETTARKSEITNATLALYAWESSAAIPVPDWASRFEGRLTGGGGGGSGCYGKNIATDSLFGAGGGSSPTAYIVIDVVPTDTLAVTIGQGGAGAYGAVNPGGTGTPSILTRNNSPLLTCTGGGGGYWGNAVNSAGGAAGTVICDLECIVDNGGMGTNGQAGSNAFQGCGAGSYWGPGGTPSENNVPVGPSFGSGGGGAFDSNGTGNPFTGGAGAPGVLKGRFLP